MSVKSNSKRSKAKPNTQQPPLPPKKTGRPPKWDEQTVYTAEVLLAKRFTKGQVKEQLRKLMLAGGVESVSARTLETVLARARANLVERSGKPREEHRNDAYGFYTSVIQSKEATSMARIRAQERIDKLLGLEAPTKLEFSGVGGGPIKTDVNLSRLSLEELEALERILQSASSPDVDPAPGAGEPGGRAGGTGPPEAQ